MVSLPTVRTWEQPASVARRILVVHLEDTLIRTDLLIEATFTYLGHHPFRAPSVLWWALRGKAALSEQLAQAIKIDPATLPYEPAVLDRVQAAQAGGDQVWLVSSLDGALVRPIAEHLGLDGWLMSDHREHRSEGLASRIGAVHDEVEILERADDTAHPRDWLALLRPRQWAKNILVAVPLLAAHAFSLAAILNAALAFVAFSACASSVYIVNDLVDIQADRQHPTKRERPFAAGKAPLFAAALASPALLLFSAALACAVSSRFALALGAYFLFASAYTFVLKRKMLVDVVALAALYTLRVVAGGIAIGLPVSEWLLTFSLFIFQSLALIKRHSEMAARLDAGLPNPANRSYDVTDLPTLIALAAAAGYAAIIVFALYSSSPAARAVYHHPQALWLEAPLLLYWISRTIAFSHRRAMRDDPVVFALNDRVSLIVAALAALVGIAAL